MGAECVGCPGPTRRASDADNGRERVLQDERRCVNSVQLFSHPSPGMAVRSQLLAHVASAVTTASMSAWLWASDTKSASKALGGA